MINQTTAAAATSVAASYQPTPSTTAAFSGKIAVVKEIAPVAKGGALLFTCVVDGITIGTSKHKDYFEFHKRRGDIVRLNELPISKFVYVSPDSQVLETHKIEGMPPARASVQRAISLALDPMPAQIGFNNQTHTQAQENGRRGAQTRAKDSSKGKPLAGDALEQAREYGRLGALRAAEKRAEAIAPVAPKKRAGRPRKAAAEATA